MIDDYGNECRGEVERLRARVAELEAELGWLRAVLEQVRNVDRMLAEQDARYAGAQEPPQAPKEAKE